MKGAAQKKPEDVKQNRYNLKFIYQGWLASPLISEELEWAKCCLPCSVQGWSGTGAPSQISRRPTDTSLTSHSLDTTFLASCRAWMGLKRCYSYPEWGRVLAGCRFSATELAWPRWIGKAVGSAGDLPVFRTLIELGLPTYRWKLEKSHSYNCSPGDSDQFTPAW